MKKISLGMCLVWYWCVIPSGMADSIQDFLYPGDFSVPTDPMSLFEESPQQKAAWRHAKKQCTPVDVYELFEDQGCMEALTEYFLNEPVWAYALLNYYDHEKGLQRLPIKLINSRPNILPFSYADLQSDDIPRWRDIFDDEINRRSRTILEVTANPECRVLSERTSPGIQHDSAEKCSARELFKYATYLDGCFVAVQRESILVNTPRISGILSNESASTYAVVREIIEEKIPNVEQRTIAQNRLEKGLLHAVWMRSQCSENGYAMLPDIEIDETMEFPNSFFWLPDTKRAFQLINGTHDIILKIAAKSGDNWAIQSYPLGIFTSSEFNLDVQKHYPLLFTAT
ncbi:MAG: hypothetical protein F4Z14_04710 [Gammaproteobacteria bacterium]|nr:hypothetical protein [Gammaproteobacteria bacterium]